MCIDICIYNWTITYERLFFLFQATDPDEGLNGQVVYEIVDSTLSTPFGLNSSTGVLFTFLEFFRTSNNVNLNPYQLTVRASDRATVVDQQRTDTTVFVSLIVHRNGRFTCNSLSIVSSFLLHLLVTYYYIGNVNEWNQISRFGCRLIW